MKLGRIHPVRSILIAPVLIVATLLPLPPQTIEAPTDEPAWSAPVIINDDGLAARDQVNPDMVVVDGLGIYVVWEDDRNSSGDPDIYLSRSTDDGVTWSTNTQVNDSGLGLNEDPHIAVDTTGTVYVVWLVSVGTEGVYFAKSTDDGATWTPSRKLWNWATAKVVNGPASPATDDANSVAIAADPRLPGHLHMVWTHDYDEEYTKVGIAYSASRDGGTTWVGTKRIADGVPGWEMRAQNLALAFHDGSIYVAWENNFANREVYLSRSSDGKTWTKGCASCGLHGMFQTPDVAIDSTGVSYITHYGWFEQAQDPFEYLGQGILVRKTAWGSTKYATEDRVSDDGTSDWYMTPDLAASAGGRVFVAWSQQLPGAIYPSLHVGESDDYGFSWMTPITVSLGNYRAEDPALEVNGDGDLYVVWADRLRTKCCYDIAFSRRGPSTSSPIPPEPFIETIGPEGGTVASNDPLESVEITFPPGAVDSPTDVTYAHGEQPASLLSDDDGTLVSMGVNFAISATQGTTPVVEFNEPVTVTVHYFDRDPVSAGGIGLYWHNGSEWATDGITTIGRAANVITSTTTHFTHFGLYGKVMVFLPLIVR